ncbi:MAG: PilN domain-containing protein [Kangiellaceae bacterium]|nr:PilN domain-containing protein [Kangiellaceae bacterium]
MANINLLDWREELRQERQKEFFITLGLMAILAALIWFLVHTVMASRIENQQNRNNYLQTEIRQLDRQIKEINELEKQRESLIARMNVIQDLQQSRPEVVRMFDELVRVVPEGINIRTLERKSAGLTFVGEGESNPRISEFMRQLDASERLQSKDLQNVSKQNKGIPSQSFTLLAQQVIPAQEEKEGEAK